MIEKLRAERLPFDSSVFPRDKLRSADFADLPRISPAEVIASLPQSISLILSRLTQLQPAQETDEQRKPYHKAVLNFILTVFDTPVAHLPNLVPTWKVLEDELFQGFKTFPENFQRTAGALLLAHALRYQISLPPEKKWAIQDLSRHDKETRIKYVFLQQKKLMEEARGNGQWTADPDSSPTLVAPAIVGGVCKTLKTMVDDLMPKRAEDEETALTQIQLSSDMLNLTENPEALWILQMVDQETLAWLEDQSFIQLTPAKEVTRNLLIQGRVDGINPYVKLALWERALNINPGTVSGDQPLADYFFAHPDLQKLFWFFVTRRERMIPLSEDKRQALQIPFPTLSRIHLEYPTLVCLFSQDRETLEKFFKTFSPDQRVDQTVLLRRLIGIVGIFKTSFPEHLNLPVIADNLKRITEQTGTADKFFAILSLLNDGKPGAIYLSMNLEARARMPKSGETKETFLARQKQLPGEVVYVPQAAWPEVITTPTSRQEQPAISFTEIASQNIKPWGEVQLLAAEDTARLLHHLGTKARALGLSEDHLLDLAATYNQHTYPSKTDIVLPDLLSPRHPLISLQNLGVLGMDWEEGNPRFLVEPAKAGLNTPDPKKVIIAGRLNSQGELVVEGQPEDFAYSPLHLLLQATALWAKTGVSDAVLTGDDMSRLHQLQKGWNQTAKRMDLPVLDLPENQSNGGLVRIPLDKKTAYLSFKA